MTARVINFLSVYSAKLLPFFSAYRVGQNSITIAREILSPVRTDRSRLEKVDLTARSLASIGSLADLASSTVIQYRGVDGLSPFFKNLFCIARIYSFVMNIFSTGTGIAIKFENGTLSFSDLCDLVGIALTEGSNSVIRMDELYDGFANECLARIPTIFPRAFIENARKGETSIEEIQKKAREILDRIASQGIAIGYVCEGVSRLTAPGSWSRRGNPPVLHGDENLATEEEDREPVSEYRRDENDPAIRAAESLVSRVAIERLVSKYCYAKRVAKEYLCPISHLPIFEPILHEDSGRYFEYGAIYERLSRERDGFDLSIEDRHYIISADSFREVPKDVRENIVGVREEIWRWIGGLSLDQAEILGGS